MHEVSIAESLLDLIERQLGSPHLLASVEIVVGPLSGVSPDSLEFCFATVASTRGFGRPVLHTERRPVCIRCDACARLYEVPDLISVCPDCGSLHRTILSGDELELVAAYLEDAYV